MKPVKVFMRHSTSSEIILPQDRPLRYPEQVADRASYYTDAVSKILHGNNDPMESVQTNRDSTPFAGFLAGSFGSSRHNQVSLSKCRLQDTHSQQMRHEKHVSN